MIIQIFGKNKCFDTKKAERYFKERRVKVQLIDLPRYGISQRELESVAKAVGGLDKLIDEKHPEAAGLAYLAYEEAKWRMVLDDPTMLKTPLVRNGRQATVGFCPDVWKGWE